MPIPAKAFENSDVYINYPQERVMFYYNHKDGTVLRKFYEEGFEEEVLFSSKLFNEAILLGKPITAKQYKQGFPDTELKQTLN